VLGAKPLVAAARRVCVNDASCEQQEALQMLREIEMPEVQ
jgi:hypothetical protein